MANQTLPRKRRTREHVISDLSVHHVEGFILKEGCTAHRLSPDYGYDLVIFTYDRHGFLEQGLVYVQLKASDALKAVGTEYVFDLGIRDYNLWKLEEMPVILILFDAMRECAYWIGIQSYFRSDPSRRPREGAKRVRVRFSKQQRVNRTAVARWRVLQREVQ